jgi:macrodomain Ter protein organizer (MatP/YcbG family)
VEAWEKLPGGQHHSPREVERWLSKHMSPAINNARKVLGRKMPDA